MSKELNTWKNMNSWENVLPPSRPSIWQLHDIAQVCKNRSLKNVAVLGSTVEFRDLLAELGGENVYVFEKNVPYYESISIHRKYNSKEIIVEGDWLETIERFHNFFDLILSDLTSGNVPYHMREKFYNDIANSLNKNGYFFDRILTKSNRFLEKATLIEKYSHLDLTQRNVNNFNCEMIFISNFLNDSNGVLKTSEIYDKLLALNNPRLSEFVYKCYHITPRDCIWWYSIEWDTEKETLLNNFSLEKVFEESSESPYYGRAKMFLFKRK